MSNEDTDFELRIKDVTSVSQQVKHEPVDIEVKVDLKQESKEQEPDVNTDKEISVIGNVSDDEIESQSDEDEEYLPSSKNSERAEFSQDPKYKLQQSLGAMNRHPLDPLPTVCKFPKCLHTAKTSKMLQKHVKNDHQPNFENNKELGPYGHGRRFRQICDQCGKLARDDWSLRSHKLSHGGKSEYWCEKCEHSFTRPVTYRSHMKRIHNSDGNVAKKQGKKTIYSCEACKFTSTDYQMYSRHLISSSHKATATGNQPRVKVPGVRREAGVTYECPICKFKTKPGQGVRYLKRHLYHQHYTKGDKIPAGFQMQVMRCSLCEHEAPDKHKMIRHMKIHTTGQKKPKYKVIQIN